MTRKLLSPNGSDLLFELGASANLNDCVAPGLYHQASNTEAAGGTNYPAPYAGYLEVVVDASGTFAYQKYHTYRLYNTLWYRSAQYSASVWTWSTWRQVPTSLAASATYLNIDSGYTLTGGNPGATELGALNIEDHLKFFVNTDAPTENSNGVNYGDYDADIWMKDNGYIFAEQSIHMRPTNTGSMGSYAEQGRAVFKSGILATSGAINWLQSGRNYSGTTKNDLAISEYMPDGSTDHNYWAYFDQSTGGKLGLGFTGDGLTAPTVNYRLHVKDNTTNPSMVVESTTINPAQISFRNSSTSAGYDVNAIKSSNDGLTLRAGSVDVLSVASGGVTVNGSISGNVQAGGANFVCVSDANGYLSTSASIDTTELGYLNGVTSNIQTQLNKNPLELYRFETADSLVMSAVATSTTASVFGTNGVAVEAGTAYLVEGVIYFTAGVVGTSATHTISWGSPSGAATVTRNTWMWNYNSSTTLLANAAAISGVRRAGTTTFAALNTITMTGTHLFRGNFYGVVEFNAAGNFTPRITVTPTSASVDLTINAGSYIKLKKLGTTNTNGTWS